MTELRRIRLLRLIRGRNIQLKNADISDPRSEHMFLTLLRRAKQADMFVSYKLPQDEADNGKRGLYLILLLANKESIFNVRLRVYAGNREAAELFYPLTYHSVKLHAELADLYAIAKLRAPIPNTYPYLIARVRLFDTHVYEMEKAGIEYKYQMRSKNSLVTSCTQNPTFVSFG